MRKFMRAAGALAGALVILLTVLAGAGGEAPERAAGLPGLAAAQTRLPAGTENGSRLHADADAGGSGGGAAGKRRVAGDPRGPDAYAGS